MYKAIFPVLDKHLVNRRSKPVILVMLRDSLSMERIWPSYWHEDRCSLQAHITHYKHILTVKLLVYAAGIPYVFVQSI